MRIARWTRRLLLAGMLVSIGLSGVSAQQPTQPAQPEAPAPAALSGPALMAAFQAATKVYMAGNYLGAAVRFSKILDDADPNHAIVKESQFFLAAALYEAGLHYASLVKFDPIVEDKKHVGHLKALPYLLRIARSFSAEPNVTEKIAQYEAAAYPPKLADELNFMVGQYHFSQDALATALKRFQLVGKKNEALYVKARYLEGVIHVAQSKLETRRKSKDPAEIKDMTTKLKAAAKNFKEILRYRRDVGGGKTIKRVAAMARLALGRLFYSTRQYPVAVRYYGLVDEDHPDWLSAIFEVSWVYFQLKQYPKALGNLHTLNSPFFEEQYYPESRVLQALILFYHCRYTDALKIVKQFVRGYYPLLKELKSQINKIPNENAFYLWLARLSKEKNTKFSELFKRIFNGALADQKLRRKFSFITVLNRELKRGKALAKETPSAKAFLDLLAEDLANYRTLVVGEAGSLAQARLRAVLKDLRQHLAGALKIKGEILKAQRNALSPAVKKELAAAAAAKFKLVVDREHVEWPFTGEYWKDELGSYIYAISSKCKIDPKK